MDHPNTEMQEAGRRLEDVRSTEEQCRDLLQSISPQHISVEEHPKQCMAICFCDHYKFIEHNGMPDHCESKFVTQSVLLSFLIRKKQTLFLLKVIDART